MQVLSPDEDAIIIPASSRRRASPVKVFAEQSVSAVTPTTPPTRGRGVKQAPGTPVDGKRSALASHRGTPEDPAALRDSFTGPVEGSGHGRRTPSSPMERAPTRSTGEMGGGNVKPLPSSAMKAGSGGKLVGSTTLPPPSGGRGSVQLQLSSHNSGMHHPVDQTKQPTTRSTISL